jgi:hypothetical protein
MESLLQAIERLRKRGYELSFRAEDGKLRCVESDELVDPDRIEVDDIVRLEDDSNPTEQSMILGLRIPDEGRRGTWTVVFGPNMALANALVVQRLGVA